MAGRIEHIEGGSGVMGISRRHMLVTGAWLAALSGCTTANRLDPPISSSTTPPGTPVPTPTDAASPTPTAAASLAFLPEGNVNVLIAGSDSRSANLNEDGRADVICVAQLTADRTRINLVSIARDTLATLPGGRQGKINAAYASGGVRALAAVVSDTLGGLPIHFTLETGFIWFTELTELLGGFTVDNRFASSSSGVAFAKGSLPLTAANALTYARERKGLPHGDFDRTERHRACLTGIVDKLSALARSDGQALTALVGPLWSKVRASGPSADEVAAMVPIVAGLSRESVASAMIPIARFGTVAGASVNIIDAGRSAELIQQLRAGDIRPYQAAHGLDTRTTGGRG